MYYRAGEEGFEAMHPRMEKVKSNLASMISTEQRIQTMYRRFQVSLAAPVEAAKKQLDDEIKTGPRGAYDKVKKTRKQESLFVANDVLREEPEGFVHLASGEVMKKEWLDVYAFVQFGKAPQAWWAAFDAANDLGDLAKEKIKYGK